MVISLLKKGDFFFSCFRDSKGNMWKVTLNGVKWSKIVKGFPVYDCLCPVDSRSVRTRAPCIPEGRQMKSWVGCGCFVVIAKMWSRWLTNGSKAYVAFCTIWVFFFFWLTPSSLIARVEEHEVRKVEKSMIRIRLTQFVMQVCLLDLVAENQVLRLTGDRRLWASSWDWHRSLSLATDTRPRSPQRWAEVSTPRESWSHRKALWLISFKPKASPKKS